jgi:signal transduction histidine kinase
MILSFTLDGDWRFASVSRETAVWWGRDVEEILGLDGRGALLFPSHAFSAIQAAMATGQQTKAEFQSLLHPEVWMQMEAHPTTPGVRVDFWDATDQVTARQAQSAAEGSSSNLPEGGTLEAALLDEAGVVVNTNLPMRDALSLLQLGASRRYGLGARWGIGARFVDLCREFVPNLDERALEQGIKDVAAWRTQTFTHAYMLETDEGVRWRQLRLSRVEVAGARYIVAIHEDLTHAAQAQAAARDALEQLVSARAQEREHLAAELHDSTGQHLTAVSMGLGRLRRLIGENQAAREVLNDMSNSLQEAMREIRIFSYLSRPPHLRRDGLVTTARRLVEGFGVRAGVTASIRFDGDVESTTMPAQHTVFRVLQEALSNVHRHAEASRVDVTIAHDGEALALCVMDDGVGIEALKSGKLEHLSLGAGLAGMRSRVEVLGGSFNISSEGKGAAVMVTVPATVEAPA